MAKTVLEQGCEAQAKSLREYGYPDVTAEMVTAAHSNWIAGRDYDGIVEAFCFSAFDDHPQIFGKRERVS